MTAATKDVKTVSYGGEDSPLPQLYSFPVAANTIIYGGTFVATNASGYAVPGAATSSLVLWGRAERQVDNRTSNVPFGVAGDLSVEVKPGVFFFAASGSITIADRGTYLYVVDDNTVSKDSAGGVRPIAGWMLTVGDSGTPESGKIAVAVGMARPDAVNPLLGGGSTAFKARGVATSIAAYTAAAGVLTANANGALGAQDGLTYVANQQIVIPAGLANVTAADAGPYVVTQVGTASLPFIFTRPAWWGHGSTIQQGAEIQIGGEGTLYGGSDWKSFVGVGQIVGTNDPLLYPNEITQEIVLVAGVAAVTNVPIRSATKTQFTFSRTTENTTAATIQYNPVSIVAGALGTATVTCEAQIAAGTLNNADISTGNFGIHNW